MIKVESLKEYKRILSKEDFEVLANKIFMITKYLVLEYSGYKRWYFEKQLKNIGSIEREILFVRNKEKLDEIIAVACLKKTTLEKKICTLYVVENFRSMGIGSALISESFKFLGTTTPLITFASYKLKLFEPFIKKYNWKLVQVIDKGYNNNFKELCFNGKLENHI
ncbi:MAG: GNAT family N-acetyltransferase [Bacilli bacterium]